MFGVVYFRFNPLCTVLFEQCAFSTCVMCVILCSTTYYACTLEPGDTDNNDGDNLDSSIYESVAREHETVVRPA